jgi:hypothetical protein
MISLKDIKWLPDLLRAELAIAHRIVPRPMIAVGNQILWRWPEAKPDLDYIAELVMKDTRGQKDP